ncbi:MAG: uroporphyrinogen-III synthase [Bacteroidales bacterium]|jgi:uroporphyrinogen-III synthase|nr:uroporphyrinogen-III synthase [Bacteroidales bacterium]
MKIRNILISQVAPADFEKSPYADLKKKYCISIDFFKFFKIHTINGIDFRKTKINILDHTAIVFSSTTTIDQFFMLCKDLRIEMPYEMKYYCMTDMTAHYLQKYIPYRKRKIFFGKNNNPSHVFDLLLKNRTHNYLIPCGAGSMGTNFAEFFEKHNIQYTQAVCFNTESADIKSNIDLSKYDMIVFFSPAGVTAFQENYPDFVQEEMAFGAVGLAACNAVKDAGWELHVEAPTKVHPTITSALEVLLKEYATRRR